VPMRDLSLERNRTLWTSELKALMAQGMVVGRFVSIRRGFARVQLLTDGKAFVVTVVDPEQEP
jgi:hypothetical protein